MLEWPRFLSLINTQGEAMCSLTHISTSQDIIKKAIELANSSGGYLLLGYDRFSLQLSGCTFDSKWLDAVLSTEVKPELKYEIMGFIRNGKRLFAVKIEEGTKKPYTIRTAEPSAVAATAKITEKKVVAEDDISHESIKKRQTRCLEYLESHDNITNSQYRTLNEVSYKTAHNELSDLINKKMLGQIGQARTTKYVLHKNLDKHSNASVEEVPNLFGKTLDSFIDKNTINMSRTEIRKTENAEHMESHFTKNVLDDVVEASPPPQQEDEAIVPVPEFDF